MNAELEKYVVLVGNIRKAAKISPSVPIEDLPKYIRAMRTTLEKIELKTKFTTYHHLRFRSVKKLTRDILNKLKGGADERA